MAFVDFIATFSGVVFALGGLFLMGMNSRRRKLERELHIAHTQFLAEELNQRGYLFGAPGEEESIHKLEAVLEDLDQEWHFNRKLQVTSPLDRLASYLGNTEFRSSRV